MEKIIIWWSGLFGITDPLTIQIVVAVVIGGMFLGVLYIAIACLFGVVKARRQR
jgi:hypothetical protein